MIITIRDFSPLVVVASISLSVMVTDSNWFLCVCQSLLDADLLMVVKKIEFLMECFNPSIFFEYLCRFNNVGVVILGRRWGLLPFCYDWWRWSYTRGRALLYDADRSWANSIADAAIRNVCTGCRPACIWTNVVLLCRTCLFSPISALLVVAALSATHETGRLM